jgi:hypothetical protein
MTNLREKYGNTALITGASSGIGAAFARELASQGLNLVIVARRRERLDSLAADLENRHPVQVLPLVADLARPGAGQELFAAVEREGWHVDILINNAGRGSAGLFAESDLEDQLAIIDLNCRGLVAMTRLFLPPMLERGCGAIINVSSTVVHFSPPGMATYVATKDFDLSFTRVLAGELRGTNVDLLTVEPGVTRTEFFQSAGAGEVPESKFSPARTPEQVVATALANLGRKTVVIDGLANTLVARIMGLLPTAWIQRLIASQQ